MDTAQAKIVLLGEFACKHDGHRLHICFVPHSWVARLCLCLQAAQQQSASSTQLEALQAQIAQLSAQLTEAEDDAAEALSALGLEGSIVKALVVAIDASGGDAEAIKAAAEAQYDFDADDAAAQAASPMASAAAHGGDITGSSAATPLASGDAGAEAVQIAEAEVWAGPGWQDADSDVVAQHGAAAPMRAHSSSGAAHVHGAPLLNPEEGLDALGVGAQADGSHADKRESAGSFAGFGSAASAQNLQVSWPQVTQQHAVPAEEDAQPASLQHEEAAGMRQVAPAGRQDENSLEQAAAASNAAALATATAGGSLVAAAAAVFTPTQSAQQLSTAEAAAVQPAVPAADSACWGVWGEDGNANAEQYETTHGAPAAAAPEGSTNWQDEALQADAGPALGGHQPAYADSDAHWGVDSAAQYHQRRDVHCSEGTDDMASVLPAAHAEGSGFPAQSADMSAQPAPALQPGAHGSDASEGNFWDESPAAATASGAAAASSPAAAGAAAPQQAGAVAADSAPWGSGDDSWDNAAAPAAAPVGHGPQPPPQATHSLASAAQPDAPWDAWCDEDDVVQPSAAPAHGSGAPVVASAPGSGAGWGAQWDPDDWDAEDGGDWV